MQYTYVPLCKSYLVMHHIILFNPMTMPRGYPIHWVPSMVRFWWLAEPKVRIESSWVVSMKIFGMSWSKSYCFWVQIGIFRFLSDLKYIQHIPPNWLVVSLKLWASTTSRFSNSKGLSMTSSQSLNQIVELGNFIGIHWIKVAPLDISMLP